MTRTCYDCGGVVDGWVCVVWGFWGNGICVGVGVYRCKNSLCGSTLFWCNLSLIRVASTCLLILCKQTHVIFAVQYFNMVNPVAREGYPQFSNFTGSSWRSTLRTSNVKKKKKKNHCTDKLKLCYWCSFYTCN